MSGIASGIGTIFSAVGNTAAKISSSVVGIGKAAFTAGAATGAGSIASGGINGVIQSATGSGVLSNVLTGAVKQAAIGAGLGAAVGAVTGTGAGKGALFGGLGGALTGGFGAYMNQPQVPATTPTGYAPTGQTGWKDAPSLAINDQAATPAAGAAAPMPNAAPNAAAQPVKTGFGLGKLFDNELFAGALAGLGEGMMKQKEIDALKEERQAERNWRDANQQRITDSYNVDPAAHQSQNPAARSSPRAKEGLPFFNYNSRTGEMELVA